LIDLFSLALTHGLLAIAAWRLIMRKDIDPVAVQGKRMSKRRGSSHAAEAAAKPAVGSDA
jgi:hypothetical protein